MNTTLNPEVKQQWVDALRSGNYPQGKFSLKTDSGKYCCLGVLCEISPIESRVVTTCDCCSTTATLWDDCESVLPSSVMNWAGTGNDRDICMDLTLEDFNYLVEKYETDEFRTLEVSDRYISTSVNGSALNDSGVSFEDIANLIEKYL
jgi:hypothetical protein